MSLENFIVNFSKALIAETDSLIKLVAQTTRREVDFVRIKIT